MANPCASSGTLEQQLYAAASAFRGQSTAWAGTNCPKSNQLGECACAAAVQRIVAMATGVSTGSYSVDSWLAYARSGSPYGGAILPDELAGPGDIIIWFDDPALNDDEHIGFCATNGCAETWSNWSSSAQFAPQGLSVTNGGEYPYHLIWAPAHIP